MKLFAHEPIRHLAVVYENAGIVEWEQQRVFQCSHICQATYFIFFGGGGQIVFVLIFGRGANCICLDFYLFSFAHLKSVGLPLQLIIKVGTVCWKLGDLRSADNAATPNFCFYT